jgi:hypothetical protein
MTGFDRKAYMKEYSKAYRVKNKDKLDNYHKEWREGKEGLKSAYDKALGLSEGIGVYKAVFPSGIYIGYGLIRNRRTHHLLGNSGISKTLNEKAISFEVISLTNTLEEARLKESKEILNYGLENLLNVNN